MQTTEKFSSKMSKKVLRDLRAYAEQSKIPISSVLDQAVADYLARIKVRPAFFVAAAEVMDEHDELLKRLAK